MLLLVVPQEDLTNSRHHRAKAVTDYRRELLFAPPPGWRVLMFWRIIRSPRVMADIGDCTVNGIVALSSDPKHHFFGYYGINP